MTVRLRVWAPAFALLPGLLSQTACSPAVSTTAPPKAEESAKKPKFVSAAMDASFWSVWADGQAEVSAYDLVYPRYGKPRSGLAVTIFVTEPFSWAARVKADPGKHPESDVFPVMKMNLAEDFQTGVYDYNEETSAFLALASRPEQPLGSLTKVSFSSQEWCGHSWAQWTRGPAGLAYAGHSYFDGEADRAATLPQAQNGIAEEQLFFWARGWAEPKIAAGASVTVPFLRSLQHQRHAHKEAQWTSAVLSRGAAAAAGSVEEWKAAIEGGPTTSIFVEAGAPHRIVRWETSEGESGKLIKSTRMKYWQMNQPDGISALAALGLKPRAPRMP